MKNYKAILFDFDMTIADSAEVITALLNDTAIYFGYSSKIQQDMLPIVGNTQETMLQYVTGEQDYNKIMEMRKYYREISRIEMPVRTRLFPGVTEVLEIIRSQGIKIGLVSLKLKDILINILDQYHATPYFSCILGCDDVPAPKPDPSGLLAVMQELGMNPEDVLYIGDSLVDQEAAFRAGCDFGAMLLGATKKSQFNLKKTDYFFSSIQELKHSLTGNP